MLQRFGLRNVLVALSFKNNHIVRSITTATTKMSQEVQTNGVKSPVAAVSEVSSGDLVKFMELVGNLKVCGYGGHLTRSDKWQIY